MFLAFTGRFSEVRAFEHMPLSPISLVVCVCLIIAGGNMLFYPERAFRSERKPRWVGLPLFAVGVIGALQWLAQMLS